MAWKNVYPCEDLHVKTQNTFVQIINVNPKTKQLLRKIKLPAENVTSAAFGGPLLDILYVTTSGHGLTAEQRKETPYAGSVFAIEGLGVHGLIANSFKISDLKQK